MQCEDVDISTKALYKINFNHRIDSYVDKSLVHKFWSLEDEQNRFYRKNVVKECNDIL